MIKTNTQKIYIISFFLVLFVRLDVYMLSATSLNMGIKHKNKLNITTPMLPHNLF
jgi:hypothetical protein